MYEGYYYIISGTLQKAVVGIHISLLHLQMQVKTLPCKVKAKHQQHSEAQLIFLGTNSSERV